MTEAIPVNLITGFLGSGKTTLLQRLLRDPALADTAVLINEFGEVGLDHHLLERIDDTVVLLKSGCVCCTIRGELSDAIKALDRKRAQGTVPMFRRLVIESSGLADPWPILSTVRNEPALRHHFRLGAVVTTVDAVNALRQLDAEPEAIKQVAVADRIVVTKTDLAEAPALEPLLARLRRLNPTARVLRASDDVGAAGLLQDAHAGIIDAPAHDHHHIRDQGVVSFALTFAEALDWTAFGIWLTMLLHRHGAEVLRVKGILNVAGSATPVAIHGVQHLMHAPVHMTAWPDDDRRSRLVFIVRGLAPASIERSLHAFAGATRKPAATSLRPAHR